MKKKTFVHDHGCHDGRCAGRQREIRTAAAVYVTYGMFTDHGCDGTQGSGPSTRHLNANFYINVYRGVKANYMETTQSLYGAPTKKPDYFRSRICWMPFWLRSSKMALTLPIPSVYAGTSLSPSAI